MNHIDEGTIHAWLDGALDTAQSAEVDAHVRGCAECAALVAEARGLIAASSRILTALDDVPANVVPKRTAAPPPARRRSITSWVGALAAAAVLITVWRTGDVQRTSTKQQLDTALPRVTSVASETSPTLAPLPAPAAPPAARATPRREELQAQVGNAGRVSGENANTAAGAATRQATDLAAMRVATDSVRLEFQRSESFADAVRRARQDSSAALADRMAGMAGCYELVEQKLALQEAAVTAAADARAPEKSSRGRAAASAPAAAPAPVAASSADQARKAEAAAIVSRFRLDDRGFVRTVGSDSVIGSWELVGRDSARLGGSLRVVTAGNRVRCP